MSIKRNPKAFIRDEAGYDLVEFALAAALAGSVGLMTVRSAPLNFSAALSSLVGSISHHLDF